MNQGICVNNLSKRFAGGAWAISELEMKIEPGEIFGLLGPNGAGKTTLVRVLTTLLTPTHGSATVAGYDVVHQRAKIRNRIAVVAQNACLDCMLSVFDNLDFYAKIHGLHGPDRQAKISAALEWANLGDKGKVLVDALSGGMRRRLDLARIMMFTPQFAFLDEPTAGLDPTSRRSVWQMIHEIRKTGCTVILTTHYMEEAERLCDRLLILHRGRQVAEGTPNAIKSSVGGKQTLHVHSAQLTDAMLVPLKNSGVIEEYTLLGKYNERRARLYLDDALGKLSGVVNYFESQGLATSAVTLQGPTLEDAFIKVTGQEIGG